jgi:hypothetical protein
LQLFQLTLVYPCGIFVFTKNCSLFKDCRSTNVQVTLKEKKKVFYQMLQKKNWKISRLLDLSNRSRFFKA